MLPRISSIDHIHVSVVDRPAAEVWYLNTLGFFRVREPIFQRYADEVWSEKERTQFITFIAANPEAGDLIRGSGGCRKVRWSIAGQGKSGGARVIYFNAVDEVIWLLIVYKKAE